MVQSGVESAPAPSGGRGAHEALAARVGLRAARVVWLAVVAVAIILSILGIPRAFAGVQRICTKPDALDCGPNQLLPETAQRLRELGIPTGVYAGYFVALSLIFTGTFLAVGALLYLRRANDRVALVMSFLLVAFGGSYVTGLPAGIIGTHPVWEALYRGLRIIALIAIGLTIFLFPSGRFVPRWSRWFAVVYIVMCVAFVIFSTDRLEGTPFEWLIMVYGFLVMGAIPLFVAVQVHRYRRVSTPVEREQTKWVVFGICAAVLIFLAMAVVYAAWLEFGTPDPLAVIAGITLVYLGYVLIPVTIAIAILRHRLFDIDVIINRTLVYGTLTAVLAAVYLLVVIGGQNVMRLITGVDDQSTIVIVVTTLLVAALFQPLRRRVQRTIDRRFYRAKYDAARTLAAFGAALRHEVELAALTQRLAGTVEETMQPAHVSLWLRTPHRRDG